VGDFQVRFDRRAERDFSSLPRHMQVRFSAVFEELSKDPYQRRSGCDIRALEGVERRRAVRVGRYRGIYEVSGSNVDFVSFAHRKVAYR